VDNVRLVGINPQIFANIQLLVKDYQSVENNFSLLLQDTISPPNFSMASRFNCPTSKPGPGNYLANKLKFKRSGKAESGTHLVSSFFYNKFFISGIKHSEYLGYFREVTA